MKRFILLATIVASTSVAFAADLRVATIDLQRLLREYHRAQEVGRQLEATQNTFLKDLAGMRLDGQKLVEEAKDLKSAVADPALSDPAREERRRNLDLKLADLKAFEIRYETARVRKETELQAQAARANERIVGEVLTATRSVGEREGLNLVLNLNRTHPAAGDVLYARNVEDLTDKVLAVLNPGGSPSLSPPAAEQRKQP